MLKRILAASLAAFMIFAVGCSDNTTTDEKLSNNESQTASENKSNKDNKDETPSVEEVPELFLNPLTGLKDLESEENTNRRPVAIMVNNVNVAQSRQAGLSEADIIYETEVEGGITRLMAVYQDISDLDKIGSVRSARYPYVDLALGHNAVYIHCGQDPTYCAPHLKDINHISIDSNVKGAKRISNGLASEHTLYAIASDLAKTIDDKFNMQLASVPSWANFTDAELILDGGSATSVKIPFPAMTTSFTYDAKSGLYTRLSGNTTLTDYFTKEKTTVKNVFILLTSISNYPDGKHRKVSLQSGTGYYITNGTVQEINWSKGAASNGFKFTDKSGNPLTISAGKSWISIANKSTCNPTIK